jgi:outer membrane beta-barrel protein
MKNLSLLLISLFALNAFAAGDLTKEMDALGANKELMKKAKAIDPHNRIRVVQNRDVDRYNRVEIGVNGGLVEGGDAYLNTNIVGGQMDFHITPRWSIGARYHNISNELTNEGKAAMEDSERRRQNNESGFRQPGIDWATDSWLAVGNWYPVYGKMNLFDSAISQFDVYFLGGAGQIKLQSSGNVPLYTAGGGVGLWLTNHFATRLEARWQRYDDKVFDGVETHKRSVDQTLLTMTMSFLL